MQKMIEFYHDKGIEMLKLGYTLPNLAIIDCFSVDGYKPSLTNDNIKRGTKKKDTQ